MVGINYWIFKGFSSNWTSLLGAAHRFANPKWNEKVFEIPEAKITEGKKRTGLHHVPPLQAGPNAHRLSAARW